MMADELDQLVEQWRTATAAARPLLERQMFDIARPLAVRAAKAQDLSKEDAADVAQLSCEKLLIYLRKGGEIVTRARGFVWRVASNAAIDLHRKRQRHDKGQKRLARELGDGTKMMSSSGQQSPAQSSATNGESLWSGRERQQQLRTLVAELLSQAPDTYRRALQHIDMEEQPRELLVQEYYQQRVAAGEVDESDEAAVSHARRQERNRVDQHVKRGRDWLRRKLPKLPDEEPS